MNAPVPDRFPDAKALRADWRPLDYLSAQPIFVTEVNGQAFFIKIPNISEAGVGGEIAAKRIADLVGLADYVPEVVRRDFPEGNASVTRSLPGRTLISMEKAEAMAMIRELGAAFRRDTIIFDWIIGNNDRNFGNVLIDGARVTLLDHEAGFALTMPSTYASFTRRHAFGDPEEVPLAEGPIVEASIHLRPQILEIIEEEGLGNAARLACAIRLDRLQAVYGTRGRIDELF